VLLMTSDGIDRLGFLIHDAQPFGGPPAAHVD
jgi:hypothetical protein